MLLLDTAGKYAYCEKAYAWVQKRAYIVKSSLTDQFNHICGEESLQKHTK